MNEFNLIAKYLAPLTKNAPGSRELRDDAAIISGTENTDFVVTTDALVENVHFLANTPPDKILRKLLRVNLSDIAAMGATPRYYLISGVLPKEMEEDWWQIVSSTLKEEQEHYDLTLIGGDTVSHDGPITLSLTMIGEVERNKALSRSGAERDDIIFVSGTIGDAVLGLEILTHKYADIDEKTKTSLIERYEIPEPRLALGLALQGIVNAAMDISDGLMADLNHLCSASGMGAIIEKEKIPLSEAAKRIVDEQEEAFVKLVSGGDDYELLFTASQDVTERIEDIATHLDLRITAIGRVTESKKVVLIDENNAEIPVLKPGYAHFA